MLRMRGRVVSYRPKHAAMGEGAEYRGPVGRAHGVSRGGLRRGAITALDQGIASVSNFAIGAVVGRVTGPAGLGAFALAYTLWILLINLHRALITDPMAILGDARLSEDEVVGRLGDGFAAEVVLALGASLGIVAAGAMLVSLGERGFGIGLLALAPWVVGLNLQDYWRWVGFLLGRPEQSLLNDGVFNAVQAAAFAFVVLAGSGSLFAVMAAWGLGATVSAAWGLRQFGVRARLRGGIGLLRMRWRVSRWLAWTAIVGWGSTSVSSVVVAATLGASALGGLKAASALAWGPLAIVMQAGTSFGLPEASRVLAEGGLRGLRRVSRLLSGATALVALASGIVIVAAGQKLLAVVYGRQFVAYWPVALVLAGTFVISAGSLGPSLSLKALGRVRALFAVQMGAAAFLLGATIAMVLVWGVVGAASASAASAAVALVTVVVLLRTANEESGRAGQVLERPT